MGYEGFKAVQKNVEKGGKSPADAAAVAAAVGRKKYGSKRMAQMAAEGRRRAGKKA